MNVKAPRARILDRGAGKYSQDFGGLGLGFLGDAGLLLKNGEMTADRQEVGHAGDDALHQFDRVLAILQQIMGVTQVEQIVEGVIRVEAHHLHDQADGFLWLA